MPELTPQASARSLRRAMIIFFSRTGIQRAYNAQVTVLAVALTVHHRQVSVRRQGLPGWLRLHLK